MESGGVDYDKWLREQADRARAWLDQLPGRAALLADIERRSASAASQREVQQRGGLLFIERRDANAQLARLYVRPTAGGPSGYCSTRRLSTRPKSQNNAINYWEASPDGRHVYLGVSPGGSELSTLRVVEVASGRLLPEQVPLALFNYSPEWVGGLYPQWLPDGTGYFYNRLRDGANPDSREFYFNSRLFLHKLGTPSSDDVLIMQAGHDAAVPLTEIADSADRGAARQPACGAAGARGVQRAMTLYTAPLEEATSGRARWKRATRNEDQVEGFALSGDRLYLLRRDRPRGRVLVTSAANPSVADARELVPEGNTVIEKVITTADGIYLIERAANGLAVRLLRADDSLAQGRTTLRGLVVLAVRHRLRARADRFPRERRHPARPPSWSAEPLSLIWVLRLLHRSPRMPTSRKQNWRRRAMGRAFRSPSCGVAIRERTAFARYCWMPTELTA